MFSLISLMIPNQSLLRRIPLSVTPYGSGNSRHDQTLSDQYPACRIWLQSLMSPCASIELASSFEPLTLSPDPFVIRYFVCPRFDHRYPIYLVHSRYRQTCLLVPVILQPCDLVT